MPSAKVLIVEDDPVIAQAVSGHLSAAGFDATRVDRGNFALARLRYERPDVRAGPDAAGSRRLAADRDRARSEGIGTPILVISARGSEHDRVHALELGADDYLVKPFSLKELVARVRVAARRGVRAEQVARGEPIEIEELRIDPEVVQAFVDGRSAELTPTEFRLLSRSPASAAAS